MPGSLTANTYLIQINVDEYRLMFGATPHNPATVVDVLHSPEIARVAVRIMISILLLAPDQILYNWSFREPSRRTPIGLMNIRSR